MEGSEMPMDGSGTLIAGSATVVGARAAGARSEPRSRSRSRCSSASRGRRPGAGNTDRYIRVDLLILVISFFVILVEISPKFQIHVHEVGTDPIVEPVGDTTGFVAMSMQFHCQYHSDELAGAGTPWRGRRWWTV